MTTGFRDRVEDLTDVLRTRDALYNENAVLRQRVAELERLVVFPGTVPVRTHAEQLAYYDVIWSHRPDDLVLLQAYRSRLASIRAKKKASPSYRDIVDSGGGTHATPAFVVSRGHATRK